MKPAGNRRRISRSDPRNPDSLGANGQTHLAGQTLFWDAVRTQLGEEELFYLMTRYPELSGLSPPNPVPECPWSHYLDTFMRIE
jgi:hypothetical protein